MGAKPCACNIGEGVDEQIRLSRDQKSIGQYDFPSDDTDAARSALSVQSASGSHIPPLQMPQSWDERGARSSSTSQLPAIDEETRSELENQLSGQRVGADVEAENFENRTQQLAQLKGKFLEIAVAPGRLPSIPDPWMLSPRETEKVNMVDNDTTMDAEAKQTEEMKRLMQDAARKLEGLVNLQEHDCDSAEETVPVDAQLGCFQMAESSACSCPLRDGKPSLELRRDGLQKSEIYELQGALDMSSPIPGLESAQLNGGHQGINVMVMPVPLEEAHEQLQQAAVCETGDTALVHRQASGDNQAPFASLDSMTVNHADTAVSDITDVDGAGLDGQWVNEGEVILIHGSWITFSSGEPVELQRKTDSICQMVLEDTVFSGKLSSCRQMLLWSDGDCWKRAPATTTVDGAVEAELEPAMITAGHLSSMVPQASAAMVDARQPESNGHYREPQQHGGGEKPTEVQGDSSSERQSSATPPRRRCFCCGAAKKKKSKR